MRIILLQIPAFVQVKMEKQPYFGCEVLTYEELWKAWVACLLRGMTKIVRGELVRLFPVSQNSFPLSFCEEKALMYVYMYSREVFVCPG